MAGLLTPTASCLDKQALTRQRPGPHNCGGRFITHAVMRPCYAAMPLLPNSPTPATRLPPAPLQHHHLPVLGQG